MSSFELIDRACQKLHEIVSAELKQLPKDHPLYQRIDNVPMWCDGLVKLDTPIKVLYIKKHVIPMVDGGKLETELTTTLGDRYTQNPQKDRVLKLINCLADICRKL